MTFATLDMIIRRSLLERGYPIHWYAEFMFHAASAIRELSKDTLKVINTVNLPVNSYAAIDLPDDFMDDLAVCFPVGASLQRLPKQEWITPLRVHDSSGAFVPYTAQSETIVDGGLNTFYFPASYGFFWNVNDFAEPTGRFYGAAGGTSQGYKVVKERRQIQLTQNFVGNYDNLVLMYISDGQSVDNATQIDMMAFSAIQNYIDWKSSRNAGIINSPEGATWINGRRLLRANLNDMTITDLKNILRNNYTGAVKN